jgi:Ca2+-binding EF-hand superfamily protein
MSIGGISSCGDGYNFPSLSEMRQKMFDRMDQDGDGLISKTEFQTAAEKRSQKTGQTMDVDQVFAAIDTNQDGSIDKSENDAALEQMHQHHHHHAQGAGGDMSKLLDQIFAAMDTNQDGVVDKTEYEAAMNQIEGALGGSTASTASASGTADSSTTSSTTAANSTDSSTTTASSTDAAADTNKDSTLLTLIQQLLQNMLSMEKYHDNNPFSGSQGSTGTDSYA